MSYIMAGTAAVGLATTIYGGIKSSQANKEAQKNVNKQEAKADAFYNNRVNRDFMETNAAKGIVEQLRKRYQEQAKIADSNTAATGGTAEGNIAAKTAMNDSYNEAMSSVAQGATEYQDRGEMMHLQQERDIAAQNMQLTQNKGEQANNMIQTGTSLIGTAADIGAINGKKGNPGGSTVGVTPANRVALNNTATAGTDKIMQGNTLGLKPTTPKAVPTLAEEFMKADYWNRKSQ